MGKRVHFPAVSPAPRAPQDRIATGHAAAHLALQAALRREIWMLLPAAGEEGRRVGDELLQGRRPLLISLCILRRTHLNSEIK